MATMGMGSLSPFVRFDTPTSSSCCRNVSKPFFPATGLIIVALASDAAGLQESVINDQSATN